MKKEKIYCIYFFEHNEDFKHERVTLLSDEDEEIRDDIAWNTLTDMLDEEKIELEKNWYVDDVLEITKGDFDEKSKKTKK